MIADRRPAKAGTQVGRSSLFLSPSFISLSSAPFHLSPNEGASSSLQRGTATTFLLVIEVRFRLQGESGCSGAASDRKTR